jgi:hypothetical protein
MPSVIIRMWELAETPKEKCLARLAIGAFFHAMRSCEYLQVSGERRTRIICVRDVRFFRRQIELSHDDPDLAFADAVAITFRYQKTDVRNATITMYRSGLSVLCPVKAWAGVVQYVRSLPNSTDDTPVCAHFQPHPDATPDHPGKFILLTGTEMIKLIRRAAADIGSDVLGFTPEECGTHSLRSAAAMAMHLAGVPVYTIMLIGRWSSDAFLVYLRPQVMQFTQHISNRMVEHRQFYSIPTMDPVANSADPHQTTPSRPFATLPSSIGRGLAQLVPRNPFNLFQ